MRNPSALYITRTTVGERKCDNCGRRIAAGETYARASLPPWTDVNSSDRWWTLALCTDCVTPTESNPS